MSDHDFIETPTARLKLRDDGILEIRMKDGAECDLQTVKLIVKAIMDLTSKPAPLLVVLGGMKSVTAEARVYLEENEEVAKMICGTAMVVGSPVSRVIGNVFFRVNPRRTPMKLFTSESEAAVWLREALL